MITTHSVGVGHEFSGVPVVDQPILARYFNEGEVAQSAHELAALQDSLYALMGDTVSAMLKQACANWEHYRKLECDAVHGAFTAGRMAPIAQMACWVKLTDDYRRFVVKQFDYMRPPPPPRGNP